MRKLLGFVIVLLSLICFYAVEQEITSPSGIAVKSMVQDGNDQVARDAVAQYQIAARSGGPIDRCVAAGMVTAAFLQAKDEKDYSDWKKTERKDCKAAGMPQ